jgi:hypothetical protein
MSRRNGCTVRIIQGAWWPIRKEINHRRKPTRGRARRRHFHAGPQSHDRTACAIYVGMIDAGNVCGLTTGDGKPRINGRSAR